MYVSIYIYILVETFLKVIYRLAGNIAADSMTLKLYCILSNLSVLLLCYNMLCYYDPSVNNSIDYCRITEFRREKIKKKKREYFTEKKYCES